MTAYGRSSITSMLGHFVVEIQSVNRKFLEIHTVLPKELNRFEIEVKRWVSAHLARGQITIKVGISFEGSSPYIVRPNLLLAKQLKNAWDEIASALNLNSNDAFLPYLQNVEGLFIYEENHIEEEKYRESIQQAVETALRDFLQMKAEEGKLLQLDIEMRLEMMRNLLKEIEQATPLATKKYREKLIARLNEVLTGSDSPASSVENEERILREIALFAEKIDIAEELTRFSCHLTHFLTLIRSETTTVGKTLEFVLQEMHREVNTIGSKSLDLSVARAVIDIKSEIERIREQLQNIE